MPATEKSILLDTSALVEFFDSTSKGKLITEEMLSPEATLFIPSIVVAEITSKLARRGFNSAKFLGELESSASVLSLTSNVAKRAGDLHAELRKKDKDISLADCIIMVHADDEGALIITTDEHFKLYKNAKII